VQQATAKIMLSHLAQEKPLTQDSHTQTAANGAEEGFQIEINELRIRVQELI
jgi:hypothetical protein